MQNYPRKKSLVGIVQRPRYAGCGVSVGSTPPDTDTFKCVGNGQESVGAYAENVNEFDDSEKCVG